jgi:hypothetical protein
MARVRERLGGIGVELASRLTYANVMATIAVFIALGGGVYAASKLPKNSVGSEQIKPRAVGHSEVRKNAVDGSRVKNDSLTGSDVAESTLGQVPSAADASSADSAQPAAFAHVSAAGVLDSASSKGVGSVTVGASPSGSTYCISGMPFSPRGGQATVDINDSLYQFAQLGIGNAPGCPSGTQASVYTLSSESNSGVPAGFYVVFYR